MALEALLRCSNTYECRVCRVCWVVACDSSDCADRAFCTQIHAGGSAVVSDLQGAAQVFLEWIRKNLDGEAV